MLGRAIPIGSGLAASVYAENTATKVWAGGVALGLFGLVEYFSVFKPTKNLAESRKRQLETFFKQFVDTAKIAGEKAKIRINVMLVRRCWFRRHFFQFYQKGMEGHPDSNLHFPVCSGFCGHVFSTRDATKVHYVDLRDPAKQKKYSLPEKYEGKTASIVAIACVPLWRELKTTSGSLRYDYFGVLNVDALDEAGADLLREPTIQRQLLAMAQYVQITLA